MATRSCPITLKTYSTPENDYINCMICLDFKDHLKMEGLFQISTFIYETDFEPASLRLFNLTVELNLTLALPKVFKNTSVHEPPLQLDGFPNVTMHSLKFYPLANSKNDTTFSLLGDIVNLLSPTPLGGFIEARFANTIRQFIKTTSEKLQESVEKFVSSHS